MWGRGRGEGKSGPSPEEVSMDYFVRMCEALTFKTRKANLIADIITVIVILILLGLVVWPAFSQ